MQLSTQQKMIVDFSINGTGNGAVIARAGTGKTSTVRFACEAIHAHYTGMGLEPPRVKYLVFAKKNEIEAQEKMPKFVDVSTFNSFGNRLCFHVAKGRMDTDKVRNIFRFTVRDLPAASSDERKYIFKHTKFIEQLVGLIKGYAYMDFPTGDELCAIIDKHEIDVELSDGFINDLKRTFELSVSLTKTRDFNDQLYFPIRFGATFPKYDLVFIDEAQDSNAIKIAHIDELKRAGARIIIVGDPNQAIFGFAGADLNAYQTLVDSLNAEMFKLTKCYRCDRSIIQEAQKIVPDIESCSPDEGIIRSVKKEEYLDLLVDGDYVLCRTTAPLVSGCLKALKAGKKASILGRNMADNLKGLVDTLGAPDIVGLYERLNAYRAREAQRLERFNRDAALEALHDRCDALIAIMEGCDEVSQVGQKIDELFVETASGITFMTVHKSKGLENDRVYIIEPGLLPHPKLVGGPLGEQEWNLKYVAVTRARHELIYVI